MRDRRQRAMADEYVRLIEANPGRSVDSAHCLLFMFADRVRRGIDPDWGSLRFIGQRVQAYLDGTYKSLDAALELTYGRGHKASDQLSWPETWELLAAAERIHAGEPESEVLRQVADAWAIDRHGPNCPDDWKKSARKVWRKRWNRYGPGLLNRLRQRDA